MQAEHRKRLRRLADRVSMAVLVFAISMMGVGFVRAQSQDGINARADERINAVDKRVEKIETTLSYGMAALIANLVAHIFQIRTNIQRRPRDQDDE